MDAQQELFTALKLAIEKEYDEYDGFLPKKANYPFVYIADSELNDDFTKCGITGTVVQTIHIWHDNPLERGTVSSMLLRIKGIARGIKHTENFGWYIRDINQRILPDDSTDKSLLHGVLTIEYRFS